MSGNRHERDFYEKMGVRIRIAREMHGMRQSDLARRIGVSRPSVVNIEQGRQGVSAHQAFLISNALKITLSVLLTGSSQRGRQP